MIKCVVFDIGEVVWDYKPFFEALFSRWGTLLGKTGQEIKTEFSLVYQKFEQDRLAVEVWLKRLGGKFYLEEVKNIFADVFKEYFEAGLNKGTLGIIKKLKEQNLAVGCLSNTESFMMPVQEAINDWAGFDFRILSWQVGARKPEEKIYRQIFNYGDWQPQEVVFIDDKEKNVIGAQKLGIKTILFADSEKLAKSLYSSGVF